MKGDFDMKLTKLWISKGETVDIIIDLKNASLNLPVIGNVKTAEEAFF